MLAAKTGLSLKQITGWFTNNRKRKYQRAVEVATKRGRDFEYVKEIMIMRFDKDLDQNFSGGSNEKKSLLDESEAAPQPQAPSRILKGKNYEKLANLLSPAP